MNYTDPKYYRLEPYHNPDNVDECKVPRGWRMRYRSEKDAIVTTPCSGWLDWLNSYDEDTAWRGDLEEVTYIVPVNEA